MRVLTVENITSQKVTRIQFTGEMYQAFKSPQNRGVWFIWGTSGSGKSSFTMELFKEFCKSVKGLYNLLEEEPDDDAVIDRTSRLSMHDVEGNFGLVQEDYETFCNRLDKRGSPKVVVIDSATYFFKNFDQYEVFKKRYRHKIIIITGHAKGNIPRSEMELSIQFDAKQKVFVNGYLATCKGRTVGPNGGQYVIWKEGYEILNGKTEN